jgi:hypothetical protein
MLDAAAQQLFERCVEHSAVLVQRAQRLNVDCYCVHMHSTMTPDMYAYRVQSAECRAVHVYHIALP